MGDAGRNPVRAWPIVVFASVLVVLACLLVKLFLDADSSASLLIAIAAISGLLILSPRVFELAELSISKEGLIAKIQVVERKVEDTEQEVRKAEKKIDYLFAYTMSAPMFDNLRKLDTGQFGRYENNGSLRRELRHLRDIGYITVRGHIADIPEEGSNLSDFVTITPVGHEFVAFRQTLEPKPVAQ